MALQQVYRQERKFLINKEQQLYFDMQFSQVLHHDTHNGDKGYMVRSLYFDTIYNKDYYEKEDGIELRRKLRLRIYSPDSQFALLEMKQKQGSNQLKRSIKISRQHAVELSQGRYNSLLTYKEPFAAECYGMMNMNVYRPKVIVEYKRKAFVMPENNIRITLDSQICATNSNMNLLDDKLALHPIVSPLKTILEVKYNNFLLSYVQDIIKICNQSEISMSKYVMARKDNIRINS